jgi:hypothetical protein
MTIPILAKFSGIVRRRGKVDRRAFRRLTPGHLTPCQIRAAGNEAPRPARTHNLSLGGAGILSDREYSPGTLVSLLIVNAAHTFALSVEMEVVRCFRVVNGDYFIGGRFRRKLEHNELMPFML